MAIFIKCPNCEEELSLNPQNDLEKRQFDCPKCKQTIKVADSLPKCSLCQGSRSHQLHWGNNTIGRNYPNASVDIPITDDSNQMSRHHADIMLQCTDNGINVTIEDFGKNPTKIQGIELINGDIVYLNPNDTIQMGSVTMYLTNEYGN